MSERVVITGGPRTGKTTLALARFADAGPVRHTDDMIGQFDWSGVSEHVAVSWFAEPGPWTVEGVAGVRALRKWLEANLEGKPCDRVIWLDASWVDLSKGQASMAKGCARIWAEIVGELHRRGVVVQLGPEATP